jgi:uncharacterized protein YdcH (DUF465 family)
MSHTPHELLDEFPEFATKIRELKAADPHFARLADRYGEVNKAIFRAESHLEPMEQLAEEQLRKQRVQLKDQIFAVLHR